MMNNRFNALTNDEEILYAEASCFEPYPNEKIRLRLHTGEKYESLKNSILDNGIIEPIIVMPSNTRGLLTIISGHNRAAIAKELKLEVPYRLKTDLSQEQADLICIETNLQNRQYDEMLYSELANVLRARYDILKSQGKRTDLDDSTLGTMCTKLENEYKMSRRNIQYYIRLTYLHDGLLMLVDDKTIPFRVGVQLSYLRQEEQEELAELIKTWKAKISLKIADELKRLSAESDVPINITDILEKLNSPKSTTPKIKPSTLNKIKDIVPSSDIDNLDDVILKAIKAYYQT